MARRPTHMGAEVREIPAAVERLLSCGAAPIAAAAKALAAAQPAYLATVARGSSDHAATFFAYACAAAYGLPVASLPPSAASLYAAPLKLARCACLLISQSGQSPDILSMAARARRCRQPAIAVTNCPASPLAAACDITIDICAGEERSVAATKTFVNSAVASLLLLAAWRGDRKLQAALSRLPGQLAEAAALEWPQLQAALAARNSLLTLGRGLTLAMAAEAALKFKEACRIHAEAFSSAEVRHGPMSIVDQGFPMLALVSDDAAAASLIETADELAGKGAQVFATTDQARLAHRLPCVHTGHQLTAPLALIVSFYAFVEQAALQRGIDPDRPRHLRKVTATL